MEKAYIDSINKLIDMGVKKVVIIEALGLAFPSFNRQLSGKSSPKLQHWVKLQKFVKDLQRDLLLIISKLEEMGEV